MVDYALASLEFVKRHVTVAGGTTDYDFTLTNFSQLATSLIEDAVGVSFMEQAYVQLEDTVANSRYTSNLFSQSLDHNQLQITPLRFRLKGWPIAADAAFSVRYDPDYLTYGEATEIPTTGYTLERDAGRLILEYAVRTKDSALRLAYTAGYPVDYEPIPQGDARYAEVEAMTDVDTDMTGGGGLEALFDGNSGKLAVSSATVAASSGKAELVYDEAQVVASVEWCAPADASVSSGETTTLTLYGSPDGTFADTLATIATKTYTGVQSGDRLTLSAGTHATAYKGVRVVASAEGSTATRCSELVVTLKDQQRAFLRNVPRKLQMACAMLTRFLFQKSNTGGIGMASAIERRGVGFAHHGAIPLEVQQMIAPYKRVRMR